MEITIAEVEKKLESIENKLLIFSFLVTTALIVTFGIIKYPYWLDWIDNDEGPTAFMQTLFLFSSFIIGFFICMIQYLSKNIKEKEKILWVFASFGFLLLTIESKYTFHNKIRDLLKIKTDFLWFHKGDFLLTIILVFGMIFSFFFIKNLKKSKRGLILFILAVISSVASVSIDSLHFTKILHNYRDFLFLLEEVLETTAMLLYINSFFTMFKIYFIDFLKEFFLLETK